MKGSGSNRFARFHYGKVREKPGWLALNKVWILHEELDLVREKRDADRVWSLISVGVSFDAMTCAPVAATGVTDALTAKYGRKRDYREQRQ